VFVRVHTSADVGRSDCRMFAVNTCARAHTHTRTHSLSLACSRALRYAEELSTEMPEVDAVIGFESYADIGKSIERIISQVVL